MHITLNRSYRIGIIFIIVVLNTEYFFLNSQERGYRTIKKRTAESESPSKNPLLKFRLSVLSKRFFMDESEVNILLFISYCRNATITGDSVKKFRTYKIPCRVRYQKFLEVNSCLLYIIILLSYVFRAFYTSISSSVRDTKSPVVSSGLQWFHYSDWSRGLCCLDGLDLLLISNLTIFFFPTFLGSFRVH